MGCRAGSIAALTGTIIHLMGIGSLRAGDGLAAFHILDPIAKGVALAPSAHAGTSKALQMGRGGRCHERPVHRRGWCG